MVKQHLAAKFLVSMICLFGAFVYAERAGGIRGMVYDSDFDAPLAAAEVMIAETGQKAVATDEGNFVFSEVKPGTYTVVISKDGYTRQVKADVVVSPGQMAEVNTSLSGDFEEMDEFVVQDVQIGTGTEAALLDLRMESPALMDSISTELMSQAGAGDAAAALKLVAGATVQDGKYATIRGLPDRYVNSQMNRVRLPTADADKRAVQLDQFPSAIIESIQVTKTFTPDQQGDASGGAVNVVLKGIPQERVLKISGQTSWNTNVQDAGDDFLSYQGGGVDTWAKDDGGRDTPADLSFTDPAGISPIGAPEFDYKGSLSLGDRWEFDDFTIGAFGSFFYERDSSHYDDGVKDKYWIVQGEEMLEPQNSGGWSINDNPVGQDFTTSLFDVTRSTEEVKWGGLGALGFETEHHSLNFVYLYTRSAEDKVILAEDTRGKEYFFPGYDASDPEAPGNVDGTLDAAPYLRTETIEYTERTTKTFQLNGQHDLFDLDWGVDNLFTLLTPTLDWYFAKSSARMFQPDKKQFASMWKADSFEAGGFNPITFTFDPDVIHPAYFSQLNAGANINYGNYQRIWRDINEDSDQYSINLKLPFEQWSGDEGFIKIGLFDDQVERTYEQESLSNNSSGVASYEAAWREYWSQVFPDTNPDDLPLPSDTDVNYDGEQSISAWYYMMDLPLFTGFNLIGGVRYEDTDLSIVNTPDDFGSVPLLRKFNGTWVAYTMTENDKGDVDYQQQDTLPMFSFHYEPVESITLRGTYAETVARQTFKELSPIVQQEYLGGDVFIGNPDLQMAAVKNYDLRFDWTPYDGGLVSFSFFHKDIQDTIEYVRGYSQSIGSFTVPVNYPEGEIDGYEIEIRQKLGVFSEFLNGLSLGVNATLMDSEVTLPDDEYQRFLSASLAHAFKTRDMVNTPEHLFNIYATYDIESTGTNLGLFYTIRGDSLVSGAGVTDKEGDLNIIPDIYETEYGTLNFSLSQKLGEIWKLKFQAKNLLNPKIESVYRDPVGGEKTHSSYTKGRDFSISLSASF